MNGQNDIDELANWINDDSKVLTKKQKKKMNENTSNLSNKKDKKISKEMKDKLNKYGREANPFYKKPMYERVQLQKKYQNMLQEEKEFKDNRMKEIMTKMQHMSEQEQKAYLNQLLSNNEIEV
jgi:formate dehydrogenase maturation protein FdhE